MYDAFVLANVVFVIAIIPLIRRVLKNKNDLKDFDLKGATLTTIALMLTARGYWQLDMHSSLALLTPTLFYWAFISYYGLKSYMLKMSGSHVPESAPANIG